jgi:hypothetical protein
MMRLSDDPKGGASGSGFAFVVGSTRAGGVAVGSGATATVGAGLVSGTAGCAAEPPQRTSAAIIANPTPSLGLNPCITYSFSLLPPATGELLAGSYWVQI